MMSRYTGWLLLAVLLGHTFATPLAHYEPEGRPLAVVSELSQRLAHSRMQEPGDARLGLTSRLESGDSRLGLPSPQEIDAIKKVAQILIMLGEQVIPTIIGDIAPPQAHGAAGGYDVAPVQDEPNDPVQEN